MKTRIQKIWQDPVGSKVIANLIWVVLIGLGTSIYLIYQKFTSSISLKQAWDKLIIYLDQEKIVTNWHILFAALACIFLLINRRFILDILVFLIKALMGVGLHSSDYKYNFTNHGLKTTGPISNKRSMHTFKIKPQLNSKDWSLLVLFSHNYSLLNKDSEAPAKVRIYKRFTDNKLYYESFAKAHEKINETISLIDNYEDQEFEFFFDVSHEGGGIVLTIRRHAKDLHTTEVMYGCYYFKIVAEDSGYDFDLKIDHNRSD